MKRFVCFFLAVLALFSVFSVSFAESTLSENEKNFVGAWSMYANNGKGKIYNISLTFLDNMTVVQKTLVFENGELTTDNKASGIWGGFTDKTIVFTLAGTDMTATIKEDGYLYMYFFKELKICGVFSKCEDMTSALGW